MFYSTPSPAFYGPVVRGRLVALAALLCATALAGCRGSEPATARDAAPKARIVRSTAGDVLQLDAESIKAAGVQTTTAAVRDLQRSIQPTGEIAATDTGTVQVTSRLPGRVVQALVSAGTQVHKGQLIATIDSVDLAQAESTYQTARAHAELTFHQLQQQRRLAKFGTLSEPALEDARKTFAAAQAAVNSDLEQLKIDRIALQNTNELVAMGEITHKPVEDAQNAHSQARAARTQAEVTLTSTKANLDRAKLLYSGGVFSKQQLEDAETAYNNAVASVEQSSTAEKLAAAELARQQNIYSKNLNGASALQQAQSKVQQDQHTYQNDLTALELARTQLNRAQSVKQSGIPINQALQSAQDAYDEAQVALKSAESTLKLYGVSPAQTVGQLAGGHVVIPVLSPIDGLVTARSMVPGQMVDTSTALVKVVNLDSVFVDAQVFEKDIASIRVGDPIQLHVAAYPNRSFVGRVAFIGREVNPDTRTIVVRTEVRNPGWLLRPGMFATVAIGAQGHNRAVSIPTDAVMQQGDKQIVYVEVAPGQYARRVVRLGQSVGGSVPVTSGLQVGDRVVTTGNLLLEAEQHKLESEKGGAA